ncbi:class I SAM-dependent methyltransferase [Arsenicicoccus bolidensis]|uniref:Class I SAM-dependent methyltransferase n=1 Tax=Arsenicicoccus bolidensis TaxID=229480 RepID=A0ABS9Q5C4_9MICO|nr:class I SAM-dependent methyltransferase [Arsenicicoccus bolidensis]MCG7323063.1 class I SAM-dependent methyltransferase [Arsenicicoccus bolidensis]
MTERALSFGRVAQAYERCRPGYPDELYDLISGYADAPIRTALEIGAGTGKATRLLARHGVAVTATEPDPAMLAELRRQVPDTVTAVQATLEEVTPGPSYDLVLAAASLHWTQPDGRWSRIAGLLRPGGVFAAFGGAMRLADPTVEEAVEAARAPFLASDDISTQDGEDGMRWPGTELRARPELGDVVQHEIPRRFSTSAEGYIGYLTTVSAYLALPDPRPALAAIRRVLPARVEFVADITVHLARACAPRA